MLLSGNLGMMEFVTKDTIGDWHFDGGKTYWCLNNGNPVRKIYKEYIPDPVQLWEQRCKKAEVTKESETGKQLRPAETTFTLWRHANAQ